MEAILLNPSILLVDLIVSGVCVAVVFFTKFNILGATGNIINKGARQVMDGLGQEVFDLAGSMYDSFTGQKHERLTYEESKVEAKKRWDYYEKNQGGSTLADGRTVEDNRPALIQGIDSALAPFVKWFTA